MMNRVITVLLSLLISLLTINSEADAALKDGKWSAAVTYRFSYDSNILRYSSRDSDRFKDGTELYLSPTETLDDVRNDLKLYVGYEFNLLPELETRFTVVSDFAGYWINSIQNFGWLSLTTYQDLSTTLRASINYFYEPRYFIRDYTDKHTQTRQHCEFTLSQWKGEIRYRPHKMWEVTGVTRFKRYAYNGYFTEYDSDQSQWGVEVVRRIGDFWFTGSYLLAINSNIGFDSWGDFTADDDEDTEVGEGDFQEDEYKLSARYGFRFLKKRAFILGGVTLSDRYYSTTRSPILDPIHNGRRDVILATELGARWVLNSTIDLEGGLEYHSRDTRASDPIVPLVKDYKRWLGWIEINYKLR